jgi:lipopolysaccharide export LptBFGC system permease protein LptF
MKQKRKRDHMAWRLDFVTALTVEECRDYLERESLEGSWYLQQAYVGETGRFSVKRQFTFLRLWRPFYQDVELQFRGKLQAVEGSTRVRGRLTHDSHEYLYQAQATLAIAVCLLLICLLASVLSGLSPGGFLALLLVGGVVLAIFGWNWYMVQRRSQELVTWIQEQLHVLEPGER